MKKFSLILTLIIFCSCSLFKNNTMAPAFASNPVIAHRGAFKKNGFPENSIAALKEAIRLQCTGSEFDVRMTADDSLIINHDPHYAGLEIERTKYSELAAKPLSNGEILPTLRQYLTAGLSGNRHTRLVLEIKPSGMGRERGEIIAQKCVDLVQSLGAGSMIVYISFDYDVLKKIRAVDSGALTQYLTGDKSPGQLKGDGIAGADYHFSVFKKNPQWIDEAKKHKLVLNAWTVNAEDEMKWLLTNGFDFITTNEPELLLQIKK